MQSTNPAPKTGTKKSQSHKNSHSYKLCYQEDKKLLQKNAVLDRLCKRCLEQLQWRLKFGKYKPIKSAKKCQKCSHQTVVKPYRVLCNKCADETKCCSKCGQNKEFDIESFNYAPTKVVYKRSQAMALQMDMLQERSRRTLKRLMLEVPIRFRDGKFLYKEDNSEVKGLYYKKKYWEKLGLSKPEDDDYNEDDDLEEPGLDDENDAEHQHIEEDDSEDQESDEDQEEAKKESSKAPVQRLVPKTEQVELKTLVEEKAGIKISF